MNLLEQRDFIEVVNINANKGQLCRFVQPLECESLYQMLRYKGCKKDLHTATIKYLQQIKPSSPLICTVHAQVKTELLLSHMLLAQNCNWEGDLIDERRTALVVQRIQNQINQKPNAIIYGESIFKPSYQIDRKSVELVVEYITLNQFELTWYSSKEDVVSDKFRGRVKLPFIFEVVKLTDKDGNPQFCLCVSVHQTLNKKEAGKRDIIFTCYSKHDRDRWIAAIDYLKTRAIYQAYAKKNKLVSLGMI